MSNSSVTYRQTKATIALSLHALLPPSPESSKQFQSPGEIKNLCCCTLQHAGYPSFMQALYLEQHFQSKFLLSSKKFNSSIAETKKDSL